MSTTRPCDVFVSYSADPGHEPAERLCGAIRSKGLEPFAFEYSLSRRGPWPQQVLDALRCSRCVVILVPPDDKKLTDYMNHEIGIAHVMSKPIVPIAISGDFGGSARMSALLSQYWGASLDNVLTNLDAFLADLNVHAGARVTAVWAPYLSSDSLRLVVGGIDPRKLQNPREVMAGAYLSIGASRSIARLISLFSQQFRIDLSDGLLIAQMLNDEELSRHDLIVVGGPRSLQSSPLESWHRDFGADFDDAKMAYVVGPSARLVGIEGEANGIARQGCVLIFARNPMNLDREAMLISGVSGYGCQGAIEYLAGTKVSPQLAASIESWRGGPRDVPLIYDISTKFRGGTYVVGSGTADPVIAP